MLGSIRIRLAAALVAASCAAAVAGTDVTVENGDQIAGSIETGGEIERFRMFLPRGAVFTAKAKAAKGGTALRVRLLDSNVAEAAASAGTKPAITNTIAASGIHTVSVEAQDGASAGGYTVKIGWKHPTSASVTLTLAAGATGELTFASEYNASATFVAKPAKGSSARPSLIDLTAPGFFAPLGPDATGASLLPLKADYVLRFRNAGDATGAITASAKIRPPKVGKRKFDFTLEYVPSGVDIVAAGVFEKAGGQYTAPLGPIFGAGIILPAGAVKKPTVLLIGTAPAIAPTQGLAPAGPAVFFGPEGFGFPDAAKARLTIPIDLVLVGTELDSIVVLTRDAAGTVTNVTGLTVETSFGSVEFDAAHFSSFQAMYTPK